MWLFVFIAAIEIFGRRYYGLCPPVRTARGWLTVCLSGNTDIARGQLEYYLSWVEWNGTGCRILFVSDEHTREISSMFERYFGGLPCAALTTRDGLAGMLDL